MIIGNNTNINNLKQNKPIINNQTNYNQPQLNINKMNNNQVIKKHYNVNSKQDMYEKSFAMLQDRLDNGLITLDEFTKKCNQLNKNNQK